MNFEQKFNDVFHELFTKRLPKKENFGTELVGHCQCKLAGRAVGYEI